VQSLRTPVVPPALAPTIAVAVISVSVAVVATAVPVPVPVPAAATVPIAVAVVTATISIAGSAITVAVTAPLVAATVTVSVVATAVPVPVSAVPTGVAVPIVAAATVTVSVVATAVPIPVSAVPTSVAVPIVAAASVTVAAVATTASLAVFGVTAAIVSTLTILFLVVGLAGRCLWLSVVCGRFSVAIRADDDALCSIDRRGAGTFHLQRRFVGHVGCLTRMNIGDEIVGVVLHLYDPTINIDVRAAGIGCNRESGALDHGRKKWRLNREVLDIPTFHIDGHDPG